MKRPLIGVSANRFAHDATRPVFKGMELHYGEANLLETLYEAGALPVIVPDLKSDRALSEFVERLSGIVLAGGADVSPESYGRMQYDAKWPGDKIRDAYEIGLIRKAEQAQLPILGVCRGMQVLNVAFGGTLYQDITTEKPGTLVHRDWEIYEQNVHDVKIAADSWLNRLYGKPTIKVNSIHHQAVRDLASNFKAIAHAPDGIIEALEDTKGRWIRAIQWHPEWNKLDRQGTDDLLVVFKDYLATCTSKIV